MKDLSELIPHAREIIAATLGPEGNALAWIPSSHAKECIYSYALMSESEQLRFCEFMAERSLRFLGIVEYRDMDILPWMRKFQSSPAIRAMLLSRPRAKAKVLRPLVHDIFLREFGAQPKKHDREPGTWVFDSRRGDQSGAMDLNYNSRWGGLDMKFITYNAPEPYFFVDQLCCLGIGCWDMIFEGEELEEVSKLPRYVRESHVLCQKLRLLAQNA